MENSNYNIEEENLTNTQEEQPQEEVQQNDPQDEPQEQPQEGQPQEEPQEDANPDTGDPNTDILKNLFEETEEVEEKPTTTQEEQPEKDEIYNRATEADNKFLAEFLSSGVNILFNIVVLELILSLGEDEIKRLQLPKHEKEMLEKAYLRFVKYYRLADKINPAVTLIFANVIVYGKILTQAVKIRKAKKRAEEKQKQTQEKEAKKLLTVQELVKELENNKPIPINTPVDATAEQKPTKKATEEEKKQTEIKEIKKYVPKKKLNKTP
jgi:hypothetical protein